MASKEEIANIQLLAKSLTRYQGRFMISAHELAMLAGIHPTKLRSILVNDGLIACCNRSGYANSFKVATKGRSKYKMIARKPKFSQITQLLMPMSSADKLLRKIEDEVVEIYETTAII